MEGEEVLRWQRERCGSVEKVHDVVKNDLAGGVMPCGRFYANAAWWRLNCLCYNVISGDEAQGFAEKLLAGADEGVEVSSALG